ncbi:hypothetical protein MASR2M74_00450 [Paracoccaceae bacterium]
MSGKRNRGFNLGSGSGFSLHEVIKAACHISNGTVQVIEGPRRRGDAAALVSTSRRAKEELGWQAKRSNLADMLADAWRWHRSPGYPEESPHNKSALQTGPGRICPARRRLTFCNLALTFRPWAAA